MATKGTLGLAAALGLLIGLVLFARQGHALHPPTIAIGSMRLNLNDEGSLDLESLNMREPGLLAWTIDITYDPQIIHASQCRGRLGGVCNAAYAADTVRFTGAYRDGLLGDHALGSVIFVCDAQGLSPLTIAIEVLADATPLDPQEIDASTQDGMVACDTTLPEPTLQPELGDVDCNRDIDSVDALYILQWSAGLLSSMPCGNAADIQKNGRVNSVDAALILQFEAGLIDQLPPAAGSAAALTPSRPMRDDALGLPT